MKSIIIYLTVVVSLFFLLTGQSVAQPLARFDTPTNGATGVSLTPTIRIYTHYKIDSTSIPFSIPDSATFVKFDTSQVPILIIPKFVFDSIPEWQYDSSSSAYFDVWNKFRMGGVYSNPNDTTLEFSPDALKMDGNYVIIVHNVSVIYSGSLHKVPDSIRVTISTVLSPHKVEFISLYHTEGLTKCSDTIKIRYNRKMDSVNTAAGPLIVFSQETLNPADTLFTDTLSDTIPHFIQSSISATSWVAGADSTFIYSMPSGLSPGNRYNISFHTSRLTGDSTQDNNFSFQVKDRALITLTDSASNPTDTLPSITHYNSSSFYVFSGDTINLSPPSRVGAFTFDKWVYKTEGSTYTSTALPFVKPFTCRNLSDIKFSAVYIRAPIDTVIELLDTGGTFIVEDTSHTSLSHSSHYSVTRGDAITIIAKSDTGSTFSSWFSTDPSLNGNTSSVISVIVNGNLSLKPNFTHRTTFTNYYLCGFIQFIDLQPALTAASVAVITSPNPPPCFVDIGTAAVHNVTLSILNHDYGLRQTMVNGPGGTTLTPNPATSVISLAPTYTSSVSHISTNPETDVTFMVERLEKQLQIEIAIDDGSKPGGDMLIDGSGTPRRGYGGPDGNPDGSKKLTGRMWVRVFATQRFFGIKPVVFDPWVVTTKPRDQWTLTYKAGEDITLVAEAAAPGDIFGGYQFVGWSVSSGYTSPTPASTPTNTLTLHYDGGPYKVKAIFKKLFQVTAITLNQDKNFTGTFSNTTYNLGPDIDEYGDIQKEIGFTSGKVIVTMDFNDAIFAPSVFHNLLAVENWERIDGLPRRLHSGMVGGFGGGDVVLSNSNHTLTWTIGNGGGANINKLQQFVISLTSAIKNTSGDALSNPRNFVAQTINPDVEWQLEKIYVHHGGYYCLLCESDDEAYMPATGNYFKDPDPAQNDNNGAATTQVDNGSEMQEQWKTYNQSIITKNRVRDGGVFGITATAMDNDADAWVFGTFIYSLLAAITIIALPLSVVALGVKIFLDGIIIQSNLIIAANAGNPGNKNYGTAAWFGNRENWWGAHPSYQNSLQQKENQDDGDVDVFAKVILQ